jgi:GT2 family glycosyltransferase
MYGEEAEWCHRIRRAGFSVLYFPGASIVHSGAKSTSQQPHRMARAMAAGQLLFLQKTRGRSAAYVANLAMFLRDLPRSLAWYAARPFPAVRRLEFVRALEPATARLGLHARGLLLTDWRPVHQSMIHSGNPRSTET